MADLIKNILKSLTAISTTLQASNKKQKNFDINGSSDWSKPELTCCFWFIKKHDTHASAMRPRWNLGWISKIAVGFDSGYKIDSNLNSSYYHMPIDGRFMNTPFEMDTERRISGLSYIKCQNRDSHLMVHPRTGRRQNFVDIKSWSFSKALSYCFHPNREDKKPRQEENWKY